MKIMQISNSYINTNLGFTGHSSSSQMDDKKKRVVLASSIAGMAPTMAILAKRKGFSINPARIVKTPIKDWAIFKYSPKAKSIQFEEPQIIAVAGSSIAGGFIGGSIVDKENKKAKQREVLNQMLGNVLVPVGCVGAGARLYGKYENRIKNIMPQLSEAGKVANLIGKKATGFINKAIRILPNAVGTVSFLAAGIYLGNKVSNYINDHIYHKKVERNIKASDFAPHFDDLCMATSMMNKESTFGSKLARFIPVALVIPGYQTGIAQNHD